MNKVVSSKRLIITTGVSRFACRDTFLSFVVFLYFVLIPVTASQAQPAFETQSVGIILAGKKIVEVNAEIADTTEKQMMGLMFRQTMPENHGMLFLYKQSRLINMWMRNTYISLDMLFIRKNGVISHIARYTEPLSDANISSQGAVTAILELNAGSADRLGIKVGDKIRHPFFK